jgi:hypothetical protein
VPAELDTRRVLPTPGELTAKNSVKNSLRPTEYKIEMN